MSLFFDKNKQDIDFQIRQKNTKPFFDRTSPPRGPDGPLKYYWDSMLTNDTDNFENLIDYRLCFIQKLKNATYYLIFKNFPSGHALDSPRFG